MFYPFFGHFRQAVGKQGDPVMEGIRALNSTERKTRRCFSEGKRGCRIGVGRSIRHKRGGGGEPRKDCRKIKVSKEQKKRESKGRFDP